MTSALTLNLTQCLGPQEIRLASEAFQAALRAIDERTAEELPPLDLRRTLARGIIEPALRGERDPNRLREAALRRLGAWMGADGTQCPEPCRPGL